AVLRAVAAEDVRERRRDDRPVAEVLERPGRVLPRRAAAEVAAGHQDRRVPVGRLLEQEALLPAPVVEEEGPEAGPLDPLQGLLRDDLVGVHVGPVQRGDRAGHHAEGLHQPTSARSTSSERTSTRWPVIAAAAAMAGLTRCVRPPLPWRPSKLRLEVEAHRSPGARMSGFIPRHIEQPASRQSKPASAKTRSRPSASAAALTCIDPGTTIARTPVPTCRPRIPPAAARRPSSPPLVQEPRKTTSMPMSSIASPPWRPM